MTLIAYRLGTSNGLTAEEVIKVHAAHARNPKNQGRVLFTTGRGPRAEMRERITSLILMNPKGTVALQAKVTACGPGSLLAMIPDGFNQPSLWPKDDRLPQAHAPGAWFALEDLKEISIKPGDFNTPDGKDLLEAHGGRASFVYIQE